VTSVPPIIREEISANADALKNNNTGTMDRTSPIFLLL
jgi:hypothetical protein